MKTKHRKRHWEQTRFGQKTMMRVATADGDLEKKDEEENVIIIKTTKVHCLESRI